MSRLGPQPHQSPGPGYLPRHVAPEKVEETHVINPWRACDRCGYSEVDGKPIARAKWQIEVPGGTLYLCGHHHQKYEFTIVERGYAAYNIEETVPA